MRLEDLMDPRESHPGFALDLAAVPCIEGFSRLLRDWSFIPSARKPSVPTEASVGSRVTPL